jgi:hypothetical protein
MSSFSAIKPDVVTLFDALRESLQDVIDGYKAAEFCLHCGAGVGKHRREGEGTCPVCDPEGEKE